MGRAAAGVGMVNGQFASVIPRVRRTGLKISSHHIISRLTPSRLLPQLLLDYIPSPHHELLLSKGEGYSPRFGLCAQRTTLRYLDDIVLDLFEEKLY